MTVVASNFERQANDLYQTESWATQAFLRHFPIRPGDLWWEPAAGNHMIADVLAHHGARVLTSDIETYDRQQDFIFNFIEPKLKPTRALGAQNLCTNPPYGKQNNDARLFAEYALTRCKGTVALLLTAKFDFGSKRRHLFRHNPRFAAKIVLYDRIRWFPGTDKDGTEDYAWYVWRPEHPDNRTGTARLIYEGKGAMGMMDLIDLMERTTFPVGVPQDVCILFEKLALEVAAAGFKRYSSDAILHRIRWHHQIERGDRGFKANDHWTAPLARWFLKRNPQLPGFFELRERTEIDDEV